MNVLKLNYRLGKLRAKVLQIAQVLTADSEFLQEMNENGIALSIQLQTQERC